MGRALAILAVVLYATVELSGLPHALASPQAHIWFVAG